MGNLICRPSLKIAFPIFGAGPGNKGLWGDGVTCCLLQSPMMQQMMEQMMSNPQMMEEVSFCCPLSQSYSHL